jgi:hypothetical protein
MEDPTQLCIFFAFLVVVPLFSTFFVAMYHRKKSLLPPFQPAVRHWQPVPQVPAAVASPLIEKPSIEVLSAEPAVTVNDCSQTPSVDAPSCNNPTLPEPLAIVVPDEPTQLLSALTNALQQSPTKATAVPIESSIAPCVESPSQFSPPVSQAQPLLPSPSSASTSTRPTPPKSTAPDWRQEALQDMALQQQIQQRPIAPLPRRNGRKSRGGRGRPKTSNT